MADKDYWSKASPKGKTAETAYKTPVYGVADVAPKPVAAKPAAPKPAPAASKPAVKAPAKPKVTIENVLEVITPSDWDAVKQSYSLTPDAWRKSFVTYIKGKNRDDWDAEAMADAVDTYLK